MREAAITQLLEPMVSRCWSALGEVFVGIVRECGLLVLRCREGHRARREIVGREHGLRHAAGVETIGDFRGPCRLELDAETIGIEAGRAGDQRAFDLGGDIARQTVAANADDVIRRPRIRHGAGDPELDRQRTFSRAHIGDIGIHAGDKRVGIGLRLGTVRRPLRVHVAAIEELP
ncbi:hypothetical protein ABIF75_007126 [Bradyrhizobium japonicum]